MSLTVKQENTTRAEVRGLLDDKYPALIAKMVYLPDVLSVIGNTSMGKSLHALVCSEIDIARDIEGIDVVDIMDAQAKPDEILSVDRVEGDVSNPHIVGATDPDYVPDTSDASEYLSGWVSVNRDKYPHVCAAIEARLDKAV